MPPPTCVRADRPPRGCQAFFREFGDRTACENATLSGSDRCAAVIAEGTVCSFMGDDFASTYEWWCFMWGPYEPSLLRKTLAYPPLPAAMLATRYIVAVNIFVIGSTTVYAVFRFVGVMLCVIISILVKIRRFASATLLRKDDDFNAWHEQFGQLQASVSHVSRTMLQWPLTVVIGLALGLALGLFSYTFVSQAIFRQPFFFELVIISTLLAVSSLTLLYFAAQVRGGGA